MLVPLAEPLGVRDRDGGRVIATEAGDHCIAMGARDSNGGTCGSVMGRLVATGKR